MKTSHFSSNYDFAGRPIGVTSASSSSQEYRVLHSYQSNLNTVDSCDNDVTIISTSGIEHQQQQSQFGGSNIENSSSSTSSIGRSHHSLSDFDTSIGEKSQRHHHHHHHYHHHHHHSQSLVNSVSVIESISPSESTSTSLIVNESASVAGSSVFGNIDSASIKNEPAVSGSHSVKSNDYHSNTSSSKYQSKIGTSKRKRDGKFLCCYLTISLRILNCLGIILQFLSLERCKKHCPFRKKTRWLFCLPLLENLKAFHSISLIYSCSVWKMNTFFSFLHKGTLHSILVLCIACTPNTILHCDIFQQTWDRLWRNCHKKLFEFSAFDRCCGFCWRINVQFHRELLLLAFTCKCDLHTWRTVRVYLLCSMHTSIFMRNGVCVECSRIM